LSAEHEYAAAGGTTAAQKLAFQCNQSKGNEPGASNRKSGCNETAFQPWTRRLASGGNV